MGLEDLLARLERDADERVAKIRAEAEAEIGALVAAKGKSAARAKDEALARLRAERRARQGRELEEARRRARAEVGRAEHELVAKILARARARASDALEAFARVVAAQTREALRYVDGRACVLACPPALAPRLAGLGEVEEVPGMPLGVRIRARDGSMDVDDTLEARLERARPHLAIALLAEAGP